MKSFNITLAPGDGVGPEIMNEAVKVLDSISSHYNVEFDYKKILVGGAAIDAYGVALKDEDLETAKQSDAILFGAVGDPRFDHPGFKVRPEQAILKLRKGAGFFANLRPVIVCDDLLDASPIKPEIVKDTDIMIVRELTGGIYFGEPRRRWDEEGVGQAVDTMRYNSKEIDRVVRLAFELAKKRRGKLTSVDKANVLDTSRLWRETASAVATDYPDVEFEHMLVDACAMHLINRPTRFDVIVTENMFGDILTDEASMLSGSLGVMPSAGLGYKNLGGLQPGLYEPIHGSAPDIAGQGIANPIGMIKSAAMMLRYSLGLEQAAAAVEQAVDKTLADGIRTSDLQKNDQPCISTVQMGDEITSRID